MLNCRCLWDIQRKTWAWARESAFKPRVAFEGLQMTEVAQREVMQPSGVPMFKK